MPTLAIFTVLALVQPAQVAGEWVLTITDPLQRSYDVLLRIEQDGDAISGVAIDDDAGTTEDMTGSVDGGRISMSYRTAAPGAGRIRLAFEGRVDGDEMSGGVAFGRIANGTWSAGRRD